MRYTSTVAGEWLDNLVESCDRVTQLTRSIQMIPAHRVMHPLGGAGCAGLGGTLARSSDTCVVFAWSSAGILQPPMMRTSTPQPGRRKMTCRSRRRNVYRRVCEEDAAEENGGFRPVESLHFQIGAGTRNEYRSRHPIAYGHRHSQTEALRPYVVDKIGARHHALAEAETLDSVDRLCAPEVRLPGLRERHHSGSYARGTV